MGKKIAAWAGWGISLALVLYDRGVRGLGWLAGPADFVQYVTTPWHAYVWPVLRDRVLPMVTWETVLFVIASVTLLWVYFGDHLLRAFHNRRAVTPRSTLEAANRDESKWIITAYVKDHTFRNEAVQLDGVSFQKCHFVNVTFIYRGVGPVELDRCTRDGSWAVQTPRRDLGMFWSILHVLDLLRPDINVDAALQWTREPGAAAERAQQAKVALIDSWKDLINKVEEKYEQTKLVDIESSLREYPDYYALEQYLASEARDTISEASSGIRITPGITLSDYETPEKKAIRVLRQEIARLEREWGLI